MMNALTHVGPQRRAEKRTFSAVVMEKSGDMTDPACPEVWLHVNHTKY